MAYPIPFNKMLRHNAMLYVRIGQNYIITFFIQISGIFIFQLIIIKRDLFHKMMYIKKK